ncbi:MAG TPA: hypothetical protein ENN25_04385, partial [Euryarchaeota archaeon]|nr:hypothetical protein [Euryarchaeota archaeon]
VANRSIMEYIVRSLVANHVEDIIVVVGYRKERIMSYFGDGDDFGASITYFNQEKQLGNGHALFAARNAIENDFIVLPGDSLVDSRSISDLVSMGPEHGALVIESNMPPKYGIAMLRKNSISDISEKFSEGQSNMVLTGAYKLPAGVFDTLGAFMDAGDYNLTHAIKSHLGKMNLQAIFCQGLWIDAVYPWDLLEVNHTALTMSQPQTAGKIESNVTIHGKVSIGEGTVIRSGTTLYGPIVIDAGCDIGPNVSIFPSTSIGSNVTVDSFSVIRNSIVMSDCSIGPHSYLSQSVIGYGVRARSHLMASAADSYVQLEDAFFKVPNIGTLVGEDTSFGSGVSIEPGTIIGQKCKISSGSRISRNAPAGAIHG